MSKIQNKPVCREAYVEKVRGAMHHRAPMVVFTAGRGEEERG